MRNLSINTAYTDLSSGEYVSYQAPVGTYGTKAGLDAGYFQGKLGQEYKPYDITNYTEFYDPNVSFELYKTQDAQVNLRSGMTIDDIHKKQAMNPITDEQLRIPYAALDIIKTDGMGQTLFSPELRFGTSGFFGASRSDNPMSSRPGVDGYFTKYDQLINRTQRMPWGSYLQIRSQFQVASHTLPVSEELQLGGAGSVRGYPIGDYLADIGGDLDTDWYFPMYIIPSSWQLFGVSMKNQIEPFIFYDIGGGELIEANSGEYKERFLAGAGAGVRICI